MLVNLIMSFYTATKTIHEIIMNERLCVVIFTFSHEIMTCCIYDCMHISAMKVKLLLMD